MSGTAPGSGPTVADRWRRLSLARRTFLLCFTAITLSGSALAMAMYARGDPTDGRFEGIVRIGAVSFTDSQFEALVRIHAVFFVVALVMGVVSARRGLRAWLAGYAGTVVGGMAVIVVHWLLGPDSGLASVLVGAGILGPDSGLAGVLVGSVPSGITVFAPFTAIAFLITGALVAGIRRLSGTSAGPQSAK